MEGSMFVQISLYSSKYLVTSFHKSLHAAATITLNPQGLPCYAHLRPLKAPIAAALDFSAENPHLPAFSDRLAPQEHRPSPANSSDVDSTLLACSLMPLLSPLHVDHAVGAVCARNGIRGVMTHDGSTPGVIISGQG